MRKVRGRCLKTSRFPGSRKDADCFFSVFFSSHRFAAFRRRGVEVAEGSRKVLMVAASGVAPPIYIYIYIYLSFGGAVLQE